MKGNGFWGLRQEGTDQHGQKRETNATREQPDSGG